MGGCTGGEVAGFAAVGGGVAAAAVAVVVGEEGRLRLRQLAGFGCVATELGPGHEVACHGSCSGTEQLL